MTTPTTEECVDIATQLEDAAKALARGDDASMDLITTAVRMLREPGYHVPEHAIEALKSDSYGDDDDDDDDDDETGNPRGDEAIDAARSKEGK